MPIGKKKSKTHMDIFLCNGVRDGGEPVEAGETVTMKINDAKLLISYGKAVDVSDENAVKDAKKQLKLEAKNKAAQAENASGVAVAGTVLSTLEFDEEAYRAEAETKAKIDVEARLKAESEATAPVEVPEQS